MYKNWIVLLIFLPVSYTHLGIDVSKWQGTIDFVKVKQAGIEIVYMRTGQGSSYVDPYFSRNYEEAKKDVYKRQAILGCRLNF